MRDTIQNVKTNWNALHRKERRKDWIAALSGLAGGLLIALAAYVDQMEPWK